MGSWEGHEQCQTVWNLFFVQQCPTFLHGIFPYIYHKNQPFNVGKYMGVSKNRGGPPKWMVLKWKTLLKLMIWGYPPIFGNTHMVWDPKKLVGRAWTPRARHVDESTHQWHRGTLRFFGCWFSDLLRLGITFGHIYIYIYICTYMYIIVCMYIYIYILYTYIPNTQCMAHFPTFGWFWW